MIKKSKEIIKFIKLVNGPRVGNVRKWQSDVFFKKKKGTYTGKSLITFSYSFLASVIDNLEYTSKDCLDLCPE